jgi:hypothetical protein
VPVSMEVSTGFNGFRITTTRSTVIGEPYARFKLRRATTTIFFALFIDVIFWAVAARSTTSWPSSGPRPSWRWR